MRFSFNGATSSLLLLSSTAYAAPSTPDGQTPIQLPHRLVTQFPVGTWIENLAVRSNGNLLLTSLTPNASVYEVSSPDSKHPHVKILFTLDSVSSLLGINEVSNDKFAILAGNFTEKGGIKGTWGVWTADFTQTSAPKPKFVTALPDGLLPNGLAVVPGYQDLALISDSTNGLVYRVNLDTNTVQVSQDFPEMKPNSSNSLPIGINGLHIHKGYLYFTNLATHTFFKIKVNQDGTTAGGAKVEAVTVVSSTQLDDFIFGPDNEDTAWLATNADNSVVAVNSKGKTQVVAGGKGSDAVPADTACQFGRNKGDGRVLYVSTGGGKSEGGKVEAIDTSNFRWCE